MSNNLPPGDGVNILEYLETNHPSPNNSAVAALRVHGQTDVAIAEHREELEMKLLLRGPNHIDTAVTYNGLGEALLEAGELQEAEEMLLNAYRVREGASNGESFNVFNAAVTRENLGRLYEAKGDWARARSVRLEGNTRGRDSFACSNYKVRFCPVQSDRRLTLDADSALDRRFLCRG